MKMRFLKLCSIALILTLLLNLLPTQIIAQELDEIRVADTSGETLLEESTTEEFAAASEEIIAEIPEKRTAFTKEYKLSNGFQMSVVYPEVVHYEKDGQWKEIDNTLKVSGSGNDRVYTNAAGGWNVILPQQMRKDNYVSIVKDGYTVSFGMAGELRSTAEVMSEGDNATRTLSTGRLELTEETMVTQMQMATAQVARKALTSEQTKLEHPEIVREKLYSRLTYEDIYNNVDVIYDLNGYQLKESVVLGSYDAAVRGYQYNLVTGTLIPVLNEDGSIDLLTQTDREAVMTMPAPYMIDSAGNVSYDVAVSLTPSNGSYLLTYRMPSNWLADPDRAWPVVLDPVIVAKSDWNNILDQFVAENYTPSYTAGSLYCGYHHDFGKMRAFLQYVNLPALTSADVIVHAELSLQYLAGGTENATVVEVHKANATWDSQTITWQTQPAHSPTVEDYATINGDNRYCWSITELVRDWYATSNKGVVLKAPESVETGGVTNWKKFYSVDYSMYAPGIWPYLSIVYRNTNGLESYWDYTTTSAGRAGTGYVNNYSGNLTFVRDDLGFGGNRMPVSVSHIYNANDAQKNAFGLGYGWRTNYHQTLTVIEDSNTDAAYVWEDGDGTKHYFVSKDNKYVDEDGLELELTVNTSGYTITDKNGNTSNFDANGRLSTLVNKQATSSRILISYQGNSNQITQIKDGVDRIYNFTYTNNLLTRISYTGTGSTELTYVTFGYTGLNLTTVTYKDGETVNYTYDTANLLTAAQDVDGYKLEYTYSTTIPKKVVSIRELDGTAQGGTLAFSYTQNQTVITDHNGNKQIMQFNNWGNVISVQDDQGNAQFAQYAANWHGETGGKGNQLKLSSKMQNTVGNMLKEGSFENGQLWNSTGSTVSLTRTTQTAYLGNYSLCIVNSASGSNSGAYAPAVSVANGETVTFSAYVKNPNAAARLGFVYSYNGTNQTKQGALISKSGEWVRAEETFTNTTGGTLSVTPYLFTPSAATYYLDCVQMEKAAAASRYNLIENGDFRYSGSPAYRWTGSGLTTSDTVTTGTVAAPELNTSVFKITGSPTTAKKLSQSIAVSGAAGDSYVLSGWAKGDSVPLREVNGVTREFGLKLTFNNTDGTKDTQSVSFNCDLPSDGNWQYAATPAAAKKAYSSVTVELVYSYNANTVYFDGIQLYKEVFGNSYTYDSNGNVIKVEDLQKQETTYSYQDNKLTQIIQNSKVQMAYEYYEGTNNVKKATTGEGVVYSFTYDTYGNNTSVSITDGTAAITASATYTADGNRLVSTKDALDKVTKYSYNVNTNVLEWVEYPRDTIDNRREYGYDSMYRLAWESITAEPNGNYLSASYTYEDDLLTKLRTSSTEYNFTYGAFSLRTGVSVGSRTLATYSYTNDRNRYLQAMNYGNGDSVTYTYDSLGRVIRETYEDGSTVSYAYDNSGALATVTDSETGITTKYYYDLADRMMKYTESGGGADHSVAYTYDIQNNLASLLETIGNVTHSTTYDYDEDNRVTSVTKDITGNGAAAQDTERTYFYDDFGRISQRITKHNNVQLITETFTYVGNSTQVASIAVTAGSYSVTYSYTYDANGNIATVSDGTNSTRYLYDTADRLVREDNQDANTSWMWNYDNAGNITGYLTYNYSLNYSYDLSPGGGAQPYYTRWNTYGNSDWGDLLTQSGYNSYTYDTVGNMLSDGTWSYTWKHGRQLTSMSRSNGTVWNYQYDANGMRTARTGSNGVSYTYVYNGGQLMQMTRGTTVYQFTYDANGTPMTVSENGTVYYYVTNLQGDVMAILNSGGTEVVRYSYNAWGKKRNISGTMASTLGTYNPLRYRGYVYDQETDLYYLQSRYYNPTIGRFINADAFASTGDGVMGNNMFAYCGNNPVNRVDKSGERYEVIDPNAVGSYGGGGFSIASLLFPFTWIASIFGGTKAEEPSKAVTVAPAKKEIVVNKIEEQIRTDALAITTDPSDVVIYRYNTTKNKNLAPRKGIDYDGLSFSTIPPKSGQKAVCTTINTVNSTGLLLTIQKGTHVAIVPAHATVETWMATGMDSIWSKTLSVIVFEVRG